jgi:SAM-dependent methyltransferase
VTAAAQIDPEQASEVGGRTLEVFSSTPRLNDWLYAKLARHVRGDVLEIGSGIGNLSRLIIQNASSVVLSDMEPHYLDALGRTFGGDERVTVAPFDLDAEPGPGIADRRFDAIVAVNVIEHIRDDQALVGRLAGLLKPGGKLAVYVPACPSAYGSLDVALGHHRRYTAQTLSALLSGAGLLVEPPQYMNLFGLIGWTINGRLLRRQTLSSRQIAIFERFMPLLTLEDRIRLPIGLGVYTAAQRPG